MRLIYAYAAGNPVSNVDPLGLLTLSLGYFGSSFLVFGGDVGGGGYVSYSNGHFSYGNYVSANVGVGVKVSAGVQIGVYSGGPETFGGITYNTNVSALEGGATATYDTSGNLI